MFNATVVVPLVTALSLSFVHVARTSLPWIVLPRMSVVPRLGAIAADRRGDGRVQLVGPSREPPRADAVALPRAPPLAGRHERAHGVPHASAHPRVVSRRAHPRARAARQRRAVGHGARGVRRDGRLRALEHPAGLRPARAGLRQPELPPHPSPARWDRRTSTSASRSTIWDQLFHRAVFPTPETIRTDTGLPGRPLVVEQAGPRPRHCAVLAAQLAAPFRPMRESTAPSPVPVRSVRQFSRIGRFGRHQTCRPLPYSSPSSVRCTDGDDHGPGRRGVSLAFAHCSRRS